MVHDEAALTTSFGATASFQRDSGRRKVAKVLALDTRLLTTLFDFSQEVAMVLKQHSDRDCVTTTGSEKHELHTEVGRSHRSIAT
jgi:hypothetical protein